MKIFHWALAAGLLCNSLSALALNEPTINHGKWSAVRLPFRPFSITANGGDLWVCGLDETISVSHDKGATWQTVHRQPDGEVLLGLAFVDKNTAHAAGTGGLVLATTDGGQNWSAHKGGATIGKFSFASANDGIAEIDGKVDLTSDGGATWQPVTAMQTDPRVKPFSQVGSVAALSPTRFAIALHQDQGENIMLSTVDAGKTWTPTHLANMFASTLIVRDGEYWAFGIEYLGRENNPGGGYSVAVTLHSSDGQKWEHGVRATTEFDACTAQACALGYGVLEDTYGKEEVIWSLPQNSQLGEHWAMVAETVCTITNDLKCGKAIRSASPQPMPETGSEFVSIRSLEKIAPLCLQCPLFEVPAPPALAGKGAMLRGILVRFTVNRNGSVSEVAIAKGLPSDMNKAIERQASSWLFEPAHEGTNTASAQRQVELGLLCFPKFPGQTEQAPCRVVAADSMAPRPH